MRKKTIGFEDPFAGTPKAATKTSYGVDNDCEVEELRNGLIFEENGLMGMKDAYGNTICNPEYTLIAKTIDYIFFLDPHGNYKMITEGCSQSGYMDEEDRPYVVGIGKVGFKVNDRVVIPPVYDYVRHEFSKETFYAEKNGQFMFLNMQGKEILTHIRWFEGEDRHSSPFQLSTDDFDNFTSMTFVGKPIAENPNVIKVGNVWVELERFNKEEVINMLIWKCPENKFMKY